MKPIYNGEHVGRMTLRPEIMNDPETLFDFMAMFSLVEWQKAEHYNGFRVSAVAPAYDSDEDNSNTGLHPKLLSATNYRPNPTTRQGLGDVRVCAEQALIDNAVHVGDTLLGVMFTRGPEDLKPIEGCRPEMESLHLCRPCRGRLLGNTSPNLLIVTFAGVSLEPVEALTLRQMIEFHDFSGEYPRLSDGVTPRETAVKALANGRNIINMNGPTPNKPRRLLPKGQRTQ